MKCTDNSRANLGGVAIFIFGFFMVAVVITAIVAQNSVRATTTQAYLQTDSFGGNVTNGTAYAVNISSSMTEPSIGIGIFILFILMGLAFIAALAMYSRR